MVSGLPQPADQLLGASGGFVEHGRGRDAERIPVDPGGPASRLAPTVVPPHHLGVRGHQSLYRNQVIVARSMGVMEGVLHLAACSKGNVKHTVRERRPHVSTGGPSRCCRRCWRVVGLSFAAGLWGTAATAQVPRASLDSQFTAAATAFRREHQVPGLAIGVLNHDAVVYARGFGVLRTGTDRSVTPATLFHMASITKTFVAAGVMQLVEAGRVSLDAPVTRYVPDFAMKDLRYRDITVRQLLTHTAGMPDVTDYRWDHPEYDSGALGRYIHGLRDSTLIAAPGARWRYSNIGFELLADLIAVVSGEEFETYVQHHILTPLGMRHSTLLFTDVDSSSLAWGHEVRRERTVPTRSYPYNRRHAGSSTLHSDVNDMLRYAQANLHRGELDGQRILPQSAYDQLWHPQRDITTIARSLYRQAGRAWTYDTCSIGLAWFLCQRRHERVLFHGGEDVGFETYLLLMPATNAAIVVMGNADDIDIDTLAEQLATILERE